MFEKIKSFFGQCRRVWYVLRKPDMKEFSSVAKISAIGILILGFMGFAISLIISLVK